MTLKEQFIPIETGIPILCKDMGFDEPCFAEYCDNNTLSGPYQFEHPIRNSTTKCKCSAPTYDQVISWFQDKYNIYISYEISNKGFYGKIKFGNSPQSEWVNMDEGEFILNNDCKDALNSSILEAFKLIPLKSDTKAETKQ